MAGAVWEFEAIGTQWQIITAKPISDALKSSIMARVDMYDKTYSRFRSDSLVSRIRSKAGRYRLPDDAGPLLVFYKQLYDLTDGNITPLVGRAMEQLGYDAQYSLTPGRVDSVPGWDEALSYQPPVLEAKQSGLVLDFGAAGKGRLVDIIYDILLGHDHDELVINAGGDICVHGATQRIELEDPHDQTRSLGYVELDSGQAICASAANRRTWGKHHHIVNPHTGQSEQSLSASWVIADDCMHADGLATAMWFTEAAKLARQFQFGFLLIAGDSMRHSEGFNATLYTKDSHI